MKLHKPTSPEAKERMDKGNAELEWNGVFRCCDTPVKGTPAEIAKQIEKHLAEGCHGSQNWSDTAT